MNTLILGIGNPILSDDGIGIKIARKLKEENHELDVEETSEAGIALLDLVAGYDKLIIIDSIKTEQGNLGELYRLELEDLNPATDFSSSHGVDIATAFKIGRELRCQMPRYISIYAIEVENNTTFGEECTEELEKRIPLITKQIKEDEKL